MEDFTPKKEQDETVKDRVKKEVTWLLFLKWVSAASVFLGIIIATLRPLLAPSHPAYANYAIALGTGLVVFGGGALLIAFFASIMFRQPRADTGKQTDAAGRGGANIDSNTIKASKAADEEDPVPSQLVAQAKDMMLAFAIAGIVGLVLFASGVATTLDFWAKFAKATGLGLLLGLGCFAIGALMGFLFGLPRSSPKSPQKNNPNQGAEEFSHEDSNHYVPNTALDEISDWLTKIIVGVGLVNLKEIIHKLARFADSFGRTCNSEFCGTVALAIIPLFTISGFILSNLLARIYLPQLFAFADSLGDKFKRLKKALDDRNTASSLRSEATALIKEADTKEGTERELCLKQAISLLNEAIWRDKTFKAAYMEKARALRRQGNIRQALELLEEVALPLDPEDPRIHYNIACYKGLLNKPDEDVLSHLKKAVVLPVLKIEATVDKDFERFWGKEAFKNLVSS